MELTLRGRICTYCAIAVWLGVTGCAPRPAQTGQTDPNTAAAQKPVTVSVQPKRDDPPRPAAAGGVRLQAVDLNDAIRPIPNDQPIVLGAAKNEWTSFCLQISNLPAAGTKSIYSLRIQTPQLKSANAQIGVDNLTAFQVFPMPVDTNRAAYVRHTGLLASTHNLPRALIPTPLDNGLINVASLRDPTQPTVSKYYPGGPDAEPAILWFDLHIPTETQPGDYEATCDLKISGNDRPIASVQLKITIYDFVIPDERHLLMVGQLPWDDLTRLYTDRFEAITPRLINRTDKRYAGAITTFDQIVALAQKHRTEVVIPRLQPTVKWPVGKPPEVDWSDFDSIVTPWMKGDVFPDRTPLGYWPLPSIDYLDRFERKGELEYWLEAATHFDQLEWLGRSAIFVDKPTPGRAGASDSIALSAEAQELLKVHPRIRATVPLEDDQVQFANASSPNLIDPANGSRLLTASPNLVFAPPIQNWPTDVAKPSRWLRTDLPGLLPYAGAGGDERDVRLWAWLAFLRDAQSILWEDVLPRNSDPTRPADPNELIWFYPGSWFGLDEPVPTVQLKWLRRAQQDYEYLWLAKQRGEVTNAVLMARLITKPVEIQPNQDPDPTYALMSGTTDQKAWRDAQRLLARTILLREPGERPEPGKQHALNLQTLEWIVPQERPLLIGRGTQWLFDNVRNQPGEIWVNLRLGIDVYNASDMRPEENTLQWTALPPGWKVEPRPAVIPALPTYRVQRFNMDARFNLNEIVGNTREPMELTFVNGFKKGMIGGSSQLKMVLPIVASDRREGRLHLDGSLSEWNPEDSIQNGPMIKMLDRPAIQSQIIEYAPVPTQIYSAWAEENFYLAFKLTGIASAQDVRTTRNFVDYQGRRAWNEDLAEVLVQPIYADNTIGPVLHLVCKTNGIWIEKKLDPKLNADPWQSLQGAGIRYIATIDGDDWRGEVAIPWKAITDNAPRRPILLRFNFIQHQTTTGESASWAGPVDFGRDDAFMGLIYIREVRNPGMGNRQ